ncbi:MAG: hypothetical protein KGJ01_01565 [Patescibacteria group bacterium]|nr:hypothetical protein [Patescibacteria group bacterium]
MRYKSKSPIRWTVWRRIKTYALMGFVVLLSIGFFTFLLRFPFFKVRSVTVSGESSASSSLVISAVTSKLMGNSLFAYTLGLNNMLVWNGSKEVVTGALKYLPTVGDIKISRDFFNGRVVIKTSDRQKTILWCLTSPNLCYFTDSSGVVFEHATGATNTSSTLPIVMDSYHNSIPLLSPALNESDYFNLLKTISFLQNLGFNGPTLYLKNLNYEEVSFTTPDKKEMYFSLLFDPSDDLDAVKGLVNSSEWRSVQYVDLRVEGRVYYK